MRKRQHLDRPESPPRHPCQPQDRPRSLRRRLAAPKGGPGLAILLPGSRTSLPDALAASAPKPAVADRPVIAVCELTREDDATTDSTGVVECISTAKVIEMLSGQPVTGEVKLRYTVDTVVAEQLDSQRRQARSGSPATRPTATNGGHQVLADTPANRRLLASLIKPETPATAPPMERPSP